MSDAAYRDDDPNLLARLFDAATGFARAPGYTYQGRYAPQTAVPGVLTEEDAFRQNYSRDREVLDALQMGWYGPRGGAAGVKALVDYAPSRLTKGAERDAPRKSIFENATGIFPDFDKAAPRATGLRAILANYLGTPARREERRSRPAQALFTDPATGERYQLWPERLTRSAATLAGDVASGQVASGVGSFGLRREDYTDIPAGGGEREGGIPLLRDIVYPPLEASRGSLAEELMERAQDLAGVMGGGPLTQPARAATLASGARRPSNIGDAAMPSRRDLFSAFRKRADDLRQPDVEVGEPRAPLDVGQNAQPANLPAVIQPRTVPAVIEPRTVPADLPHAELTERLARAVNPELDRRALLRGVGSAAVAGSRAARIAETLTARPEAVAAAKPEALPKFEEIWKRGDPAEYDIDFYDLPASEQKKIEREFLETHDMTKRQAIKEWGRDDYDTALAEHFEEGKSANDEGTRYSDYQLPGGDNYRELLIKHPGPAPEFGFKKEDIGEGFQSSVWDEPDVIGHLRMHDRDIPGVGRSTHLEELNSEWHQEGKQKGYGPQRLTADDVVLDPPLNKRDVWVVRDKNGELIANYDGAMPKSEVLKDITSETNLIGRPPDAPLKDTWPDFLLRRAIKEAVDNNHDAVSWTPGTHQAQRYDMTPEEYPHSAATRGVMDFYDKHLVDRANEIGRQYGTKVEKRNTDLNPNVEIKPSSKIKGVWNVSKDGKEIQGDFGSQEAAANYAKEYGYKGTDVPVLRITPQLRRAVKDGTFSLVSDSGKPGAPLAALQRRRRHYYDNVGVFHYPKDELPYQVEYPEGETLRSFKTEKEANDFMEGYNPDVLGGLEKPSGPFLVPAYKRGNKIHKGEIGQQHEDVFGVNVSGDAELERGFVNHKGHFLTPERAVQYALDKGLIPDPKLEKLLREHPGMFTADFLLSDSGKPGAPLAALENAPRALSRKAEKLLSNPEDYFDISHDLSSAGYIMPNGKGIKTYDLRSEDPYVGDTHDHVARVAGYDGVEDFLRDTGIIRKVGGRPEYNFVVAPNDRQLKSILKDYYKYDRRSTPLLLEQVQNDWTKPVAYKNFEKPNLEQIKNWLYTLRSD